MNKAAPLPEEEAVDDHLDIYDLGLGMDEEIPEILPYRNALEDEITFVSISN